MAGAKEEKKGQLEEAIRALLQSQATLVQTQASIVSQSAAMEKQFAEMKRDYGERFSRIEAILLEHSRILHALPEAVREKVGFKAA